MDNPLAAEKVSEDLGIPVLKQQIEHLTVNAALDFDTFYESKITEEKSKQLLTQSDFIVLIGDFDTNATKTLAMTQSFC